MDPKFRLIFLTSQKVVEIFAKFQTLQSQLSPHRSNYAIAKAAKGCFVTSITGICKTQQDTYLSGVV